MSYLHDWRPDLSLGSSLTLSVWAASLFLIILGLLPFSDVIHVAKWGVAFLVMACWGYIHRHYVLLRAKDSVKRIQWAGDGWLLTTNKQIEGPFVLLASSRVARNFILLHFRRPSDRIGVRFVVPILKDSLDEDSYRSLQIFLRWQKASMLNPALHPQEDG